MKLDLSRLDPRPPGFGACGSCPYRDSGGTVEICWSCADGTLKQIPESACEVCCHPVDRGGACRNPLCSFWDLYFDRAHALALRSGALQRTIGLYKYVSYKGWARIFGRLLVGYLDEHAQTFRDFDLIVASPTFVDKSGKQGRGWDHTRLILQAASVEAPGRWPFDLEEPAAIVKTKPTTPLAGKSWKQRKEIAEGELRGSLSIPRPGRTGGKNILVYDDVFTDGFTLREVARCLIEDGGARQVSGVVLARQVFTPKGGAP